MIEKYERKELSEAERPLNWELIHACQFLLRIISVRLKRQEKIRFAVSAYIRLFCRYYRHWYVEKPAKGQGYRCIFKDSERGLEEVFKEALKDADILRKDLILPLPCFMLWVNPGGVYCRFGGDHSPHGWKLSGDYGYTDDGIHRLLSSGFPKQVWDELQLNTSLTNHELKEKLQGLKSLLLKSDIEELPVSVPFPSLCNDRPSSSEGSEHHTRTTPSPSSDDSGVYSDLEIEDDGDAPLPYKAPKPYSLPHAGPVKQGSSLPMQFIYKSNVRNQQTSADVLPSHSSSSSHHVPSARGSHPKPVGWRPDARPPPAMPGVYMGSVQYQRGPFPSSCGWDDARQRQIYMQQQALRDARHPQTVH